MGVGRRNLLAAGIGAGVALPAGAALGYFGAGLLSGERPDVPGFVWSDDHFPPFRNDQLVGTAPSFEGDEAIGLRHPKDSPTVAVVATLATGLGLLNKPGARLGLVYTDPGDTWHQGMGLSNQLFGAAVEHGGELMVAAALGIGKGDVEFSWAVRSDGLTVPLSTSRIDVIPRSELEERFPGLPAL